MNIGKKIRTIKTSIVFVTVFMCFSLAGGLYSATNFLKNKSELTNKITRFLKTSDQIDQLDQAILTLSHPEVIEKEDRQYILRRTTEDMIETLQTLGLSSSIDLQKKWGSRAGLLKASQLLTLAEAGRAKRTEFSQYLVGLQDQLIAANQGLIYAGIATFIFGIVLPLVLMGYLTRALKKARADVENSVRQWMQDWLAAQKEFGQGQAFQNPEFWLQTGLITVQSVSSFSSHPIVFLLADLTRIMREELVRQKKDKDSPSSLAS